MNECGLLFLAGFAGSMHCAGMCGGFACALGGNGAANITRQLIYNLGRIATYSFIGAMVGQLGLLLIGHSGEGSWASYAQQLLACFSGVLMVVVGLQFFGWRMPFRRVPKEAGVTLARGMKQMVSAPGLRAPLALGVFNGFLPCPLIYAFAAQAASSGGALPGLMVMLTFGLGTLPAMLTMGVIGMRWQRSGLTVWHFSGIHMAGAFIILLGLITFARGILPMSTHLHGA
jgi:sulfite exporter TauE/SafE